MSSNFRKLERIVVFFAKQHKRSKKETNSRTKVHLNN